MKIETKENYIVVSAEDGKFIYNKSEANPTLVEQILMPISTSEETIKQTYKEIEKDTIFQTSTKYSKLLLIRNLKAENLWEEIKQFIQNNNLEDEWDACQNLDENDSVFQPLISSLKLKYGEEKVEEILQKSAL